MNIQNSKDHWNIICLFLNKDLNDKTFILSIINQLRVDRYDVSVEKSSDLLNICNHLVEVCECEDSDIRKAFKNLQIETFDIGDMKTMQCLKYFNVAYEIWLIELKLNVNDFILNTRKAELWWKRKEVLLYECEVNDVDEVVINNREVSLLDGYGYDNEDRLPCRFSCLRIQKRFRTSHGQGTRCYGNGKI